MSVSISGVINLEIKFFKMVLSFSSEYIHFTHISHELDTIVFVQIIEIMLIGIV